MMQYRNRLPKNRWSLITSRSKSQGKMNSSDRIKKTKLKNKKRRVPTSAEAGVTEDRTKGGGDAKPPKKRRRGATVGGNGKQEAGSGARDADANYKSRTSLTISS